MPGAVAGARPQNAMANTERDDSPAPLGPEHSAGSAISWWLDANDALEGRRVRHAFVDQLRAFGYTGEACFRAELALGEMLGNVVRHAGGKMLVRLDTTAPEAVVHVLDEGCGFAYDAKPAQDTWAESGRGLALIQLMVGDFAVRSRNGGGAHVQAVLRRLPPRVSLRSDAAAALKRNAP
jgi:anti-sigma regulatory factor (Ser/Thr protein kinase)